MIHFADKFWQLNIGWIVFLPLINGNSARVFRRSFKSYFSKTKLSWKCIHFCLHTFKIAAINKNIWGQAMKLTYIYILSYCEICTWVSFQIKGFFSNLVSRVSSIFLVLYKCGYCMISWFALTNDLRWAAVVIFVVNQIDNRGYQNRRTKFREVEARNNGIFFLVIQIFFCRFSGFFRDFLREYEVIGDWWKMMELGYFQ